MLPPRVFVTSQDFTHMQSTNKFAAQREFLLQQSTDIERSISVSPEYANCPVCQTVLPLLGYADVLSQGAL